MTTPAAAALYEARHVFEHEGRGNALFNPQNKPAYTLPVIYGFNNGGNGDWLHAELLAEDGTPLGGHICSSESYMPADLGVLAGTREDRHIEFRKHYPGGYRMEFVGHADVPTNIGLMTAIQLAIKNESEAESVTATP